MIRQYIDNELTYFSFEYCGYSFIAFTLSELLNNLPNELRLICLTQLN